MKKPIYLLIILQLMILFLIFSISALSVTYNSTSYGGKNKYCASGLCEEYDISNQIYVGGALNYNAFIYFYMPTLENKNLTITSAYINLTVSETDGSFLIPVSKILQTWIINDSEPTTSSNYSSYYNGAIRYGNQSVDVTDIVKEYANGSSTNYGFLLNGSLGSQFNYVYYYSINGTVSRRPTLIVNYNTVVTTNLTTPLNYTNSSTGLQYLVCNSSSSDNLNLDTAILKIWSTNGTLVNTTNIKISGNTNLTNFTYTFGDGSFYWNCEVNNTDGAIDTDLNRTITIDSTSPSITINSPIDSSSYSTSTIWLNTTVTDSGIGLNQCWWQNNTGANISISCNQNSTFTQSDGNKYVYFWANDSLGNIANKSVYYQISTGNPSLNLNFPTNNQYLSSGLNVNLNYTPSYPSNPNFKNSSLFGNFSGSWILNQTNSSIITDSAANTFKVNLSDGVYLWNVRAFDTTGKNGTGLTNSTFTIDTVFPNTTINSISTTDGNYVFSFNATSSDLNLASCKYIIQNSSGSNMTLNISFSCNTVVSNAQVTSFDNFSLVVYSLDLAGNENSSTKSFVVNTASNGTVIINNGGTTQQTMIVTGANATWSITTETLGKSYVFFMDQNSTKSKPLYLKNLGTNQTIVNFSCEDISGNLCQYVKFEHTTLLLLPNKNLDQIISFNVTLPQDVLNGVYDFNIVATNAIDGAVGKVSVRVLAGESSGISWFVDRIVGKTTFDLSFINDKLNNIIIYNWFILLFMIIFLSIVLYFGIFSFFSARFPLTVVVVFITVGILLFFLG